MHICDAIQTLSLSYDAIFLLSQFSSVILDLIYEKVQNRVRMRQLLQLRAIITFAFRLIGCE